MYSILPIEFKEAPSVQVQSSWLFPLLYNPPYLHISQSHLLIQPCPRYPGTRKGSDVESERMRECQGKGIYHNKLQDTH